MSGPDTCVAHPSVNVVYHLATDAQGLGILREALQHMPQEMIAPSYVDQRERLLEAIQVALRSHYRVSVITDLSEKVADDDSA